VKQYPVKLMCKVLNVSRSGFYACQKRPTSKRTEYQMKLTEQIATAHAGSRGTYGSPRITMELKSQNVKVCENTVAKYMAKAGIKSIVKKRFVPRTTQSEHAYPVADNLLDQDFVACAPNQKWTCDITYIWTDTGWLYLAVVIDLFSRKVVGWNMRHTLHAQLVIEALTMAISNRCPAAGLVHHSDRGSQYACHDYRAMQEQAGIISSMSRAGNCYDNAVAESFFATLKNELVNHQRYKNLSQAMLSVFEWIEVFYNRRRRHSSLGYLSPEAFEAQNN
jgi:transposase InsO family protein